MTGVSVLLAIAAGLFAAGLFGVLARRTILMQLISLEIMLAGPALAFVAAGAHHGMVEGTAMFLIVLALAAAEVALGLAIYLQLRRDAGDGDADAARRLRG
ncbi:NADH-quinone oxidoreductase subunit NuoK [Rhodosalinus sediminis]|jgi:NADH-quinone oxidoreductase subunit K|uniref:NADH-quinone oxidoreductase subunit K n=1 Tax=Rhodosalinus sediminis TaxID=1940533 RepID=A0A3D9BXC7_9RHOB|nr:NADH-quinone oxidoreductase subunit NuoK [Rhodosalinus sediminis]REC58175.1 NADH-quinone oxidoreductase subunit NuoK [Rhodosalinus sediminis]